MKKKNTGISLLGENLEDFQNDENIGVLCWKRCCRTFFTLEDNGGPGSVLSTHKQKKNNAIATFARTVAT
jgi:hypothetical protein